MLGIAGIAGYSSKDFFKTPKSLAFAIGYIYVEESDECSVVFAFEEHNFNHTCVIGLPITIKNNSRYTAKNVDVLLKYSSPLRAYPSEMSKSISLGIYNNIKHLTGEAGAVSTSSFNIVSIAPEKSVLLIDAIMWENDISRIDSLLTVDITINVDDRPSRNHRINIWPALITGSEGMLSISMDALNADHRLLVYFDNYNLMKSKINEQEFYTFISMEEVIYQELTTKK